MVTLPGAGRLTLNGAAVTGSQVVPKADLDGGKLAFTPAANAHGDDYASFTFRVSDGTVESAAAYAMTIDVTAVNDPAYGAPAITGTPWVGQALTAAPGTIGDDDGLSSPAYRYRWLRVVNGVEGDIAGATASSYTLAAADLGHRVKVKVSFQDDDGSGETRTSAATAAVTSGAAVAGTPPSVSIAAVYPGAAQQLAPAEFRVTLSAPAADDVTVNLSIAQDDTYLSDTIPTVVIEAGDASATGEFAIAAAAASGRLTATVAAGSGYTPAAAPDHAAAVQVAAGPPLTLAWQPEDYTVAEGESVDLEVVLRTAAGVPRPRASYRFRLDSADDAATAERDYTAISREVEVAPGDWRADGRVFSATASVTLQTLEDGEYEGAERVSVRFGTVAGQVEHTRVCSTEHQGTAHQGTDPGTCNAFVVIRDIAGALALTGVRVSSTPDSGNTYRRGESIEFTATFNGPVTVTGRPQFRFFVGVVARQADYVRGSDSTELVFSYRVAAGDRDDDGISWATDALARNGGSIRFTTDDAAAAVDAVLTHRSRRALAAHRVDASADSSTALVSNLAEGGGSTIVDRYRAQRFWTGSHHAGYVLSRVEVESEDVDGDSFSLSVCSVDAGRKPTEECTALTAPDSFGAGTLAFTAPANLVLGAETEYAVVLAIPPARSIPLGTTTSAVELTSSAGWRIVDEFDWWDSAGSSWRTTGGTSLRIAIAGTVALRVSNREVTTAEDTAYTFQAGDFNVADANTGDELASVKVVTLPAAGRLTLDGAAVAENQVVPRADLDGGLLTFTPAANAHGDDYASFTFKVSDGTNESLNAYTVTIDVTAVNDPAYGAPAIAGTAQVGQTLTASPGTIGDADGLSSPGYRYQWVRVVNGVEGNIAGATASSYTLAAADHGHRVKVTVSFQDDGRGSEARTSAATPVGTPPSVSVAAVYPQAAQQLAPAEFRVTLSAPAAQDVKVNLSITQDHGYLAGATQTIVIPSGDLAATREFSLAAAAASGSLTATVAPGVAYTPAAAPDNAASVEVASPPLTLAWEPEDYTVAEGEGVDLNVVLRTTARPRNGFRFRLASADDTAVIFDDYRNHDPRVEVAAGDWTADGSGFSATRRVGLQTLEDSAYEGDERFFVRFGTVAGQVAHARVCSAGHQEAEPSICTAFVVIEDDDTLALTGVTVTSTPVAGDTYGAGESIQFTATFNGPVTVTGTPRFGFLAGVANEQADYVRGSGSTELVFSYPVTAGDLDADGIAWAEDALALNGGSIRFKTAETAAAVDAALTHRSQAALAGHKVSAAVPDAPAEPDEPAEPAEPTTTTASGPLVSNLASGTDSEDSSVAGDGDLAQRFLTGAHVQGYVLSGVEVISEDAEGDAFALSVCTVARNRRPTGDCTGLTPPGDFAAGRLTFTAPANLVLEAGTWYAVVFDIDGTVTLDATTSHDQVSSDAGWRIQNAHDAYRGSWSIQSGNVLRIAIEGAVHGTEPVVAASATVTTNEDTAYELEAGDFDFAATAASLTLASVKVVTLPGAGRLTLNGAAVTASQEVPRADLDGGKLAFTPAANAHGDDYASFTFKVSDGTVESAAAYAMTIDVTAVNDPAYGAPAITGTPWVRQALTATPGTIGDADGLSSPAYRYRWLRVVNGVEGDIAGATASSYTLAAADLGHRVKVKVSFQDDDGSGETRTSAATVAVTSGEAVAGTPPSVSIAAVYPGAAQQLAPAEFRVTLSAPAADDVTVNLSIAQDDTYLSDTIPTVVIEAGDASATGEFAIAAAAASGRLTATVAAGSGYTPAAAPDHAAAVQVAASPPLTLAWQPEDYTVAEGESVDLEVVLRTAAGVPRPRASYRFRLDSADHVATADEDYTALSREVAVAAGDWSADGLVFRVTRRVTLSTLEDAAYEGDERFFVRFGTVAGEVEHTRVCSAEHREAESSICGAFVVIEDDDTLALTGVTVTSTPVAGDTYGAGESIQFTAAFNGPVTVTGTPRFGFLVGVANEQADYVRGSGSTELVFSYPVAAGDLDADGISWAEDALALNGGSIRFKTAETAAAVDAALTHRSQAALAGHKVSAAEPDVPATIASGTLVGNLASGTDSEDSSVAGDGDLAQRFLTGAHVRGYVLSGVEVISEDAEGDAFALSVCTVARNRRPTGDCTGLTPPGDFAAGRLTFTAPANLVLEAGTWYAVVFDIDGTVTLDATTSHDQVSSDAGWRIQNAHDAYRGSWSIQSGNVLRIAIEGAVHGTEPVVAASATVTTNEDTAYELEAGDFDFAATAASLTLASVKVVTLPGAGRLTLNGAAVTGSQVVPRADLDGGKLAFTPAANAHGDDYASFTFRVSDGTVESAAAYAMTIDVTAVNDPAYGAPAITGTPWVGQALTAAPGTIGDDDGLSSPAYRYQWLRVVNGVEGDVAGATASSYTLAAADLGHRVKVKVSFQDDDGSGETRTSAATAAVTSGAAVAGTPPSVSIAAVYPGAAQQLAPAEFRVTLSAPAADDVTVNLSIAQDDTYLSDTTPTVVIEAGRCVGDRGVRDRGRGGERQADGDGGGGQRLHAGGGAGQRRVSGGGGESAADAGVGAGGLYGGRRGGRGPGGGAAHGGGGAAAARELPVPARQRGRRGDGGAGLHGHFPGGRGACELLEGRRRGVQGDQESDAADPGGRRVRGRGAGAGAIRHGRGPGGAHPGVLHGASGHGASGYGPGHLQRLRGDQGHRRCARAHRGEGELDPGFGQHLPAGREHRVHRHVQRAGHGDRPAAVPVLRGRRGEAGRLRARLGQHGAGVLLPRGGGRPRRRRDLLGHGTRWRATAAASGSRPTTRRPAVDAVLTHRSRRALAAHRVDASADSSTALVSNLAEGGGSTIVDRYRAQRFWTGSHHAGYVLSRVEVESEDVDGDSFSLSVCSVDAGRKPTEECTALTAPDSFGAGTLAFTAPANLVLGAETEYAVVLAIPPARSIPLGTTTSAVELTSSAGWRIVDEFDWWDSAGSSWRTTGGTSLRIAIAGTVALRVSNREVTTAEDTAYTFQAGDFNVADANTGDELASVKVVTLPAAGRLTLDGAAVAENQVVPRADLDGGLLTFTPAANAHGDDYASFTFKVSDGTNESLNAYTVTIDVTAVNDPAYGAPAIAGTAQVGQTLTASPGTIGDADGLSSPGYRYQWVRVVNGVEGNIAGATASSYTLAAADHGHRVKVTVSFQDDGRGSEARTSAATPVGTPPSVSVAAVYPQAAQQLAPAEFRVTLSAPAAQDVKVNLSITQDHGYLAGATQTIVIPSGDLAATREFSLAAAAASGSLTATVAPGVAYTPAAAPDNAASVEVASPPPARWRGSRRTIRWPKGRAWT